MISSQCLLVPQRSLCLEEVMCRWPMAATFDCTLAVATESLRETSPSWREDHIDAKSTHKRDGVLLRGAWGGPCHRLRPWGRRQPPELVATGPGIRQTVSLYHLRPSRLWAIPGCPQ